MFSSGCQDNESEIAMEVDTPAVSSQPSPVHAPKAEQNRTMPLQVQYQNITRPILKQRFEQVKPIAVGRKSIDASRMAPPTLLRSNLPRLQIRPPIVPRQQIARLSYPQLRQKNPMRQQLIRQPSPVIQRTNLERLQSPSFANKPQAPTISAEKSSQPGQSPEQKHGQSPVRSHLKSPVITRQSSTPVVLTDNSSPASKGNVSNQTLVSRPNIAAPANRTGKLFF